MTKYIKKMILIFIIFFSFSLSADAKVNEVNIYLFYGETCPHCEAEQEYLEVLQQEYSNIRIYKYEVWNNASNKQLMLNIKNALGNTSDVAVPFTVIGDYSFLGYSDGNNSIFKEKIDFYTTNTYTNKTGSLLGISYDQIEEEVTTSTDSTPASNTNTTEIKETVTTPKSIINDFKEKLIDEIVNVMEIVEKNIIITIIAIASILTLIACLIIRITEIKITNKNNRKLRTVNKHFDVANIQKYVPDFDEETYKVRLFDIFIEVQKAIEEFELESIKDIVTPNNYALLDHNLKKLRENNERIVMEDIEFRDMIFTSIKEDNGDLILECFLRFTCKNYIANKFNNDLVKGKRKQTRFDYKLIFIKENYKDTNTVTRCPYCDGPAQKEARECEFCGKKLNNKSNFVLSKFIYIKKRIIE